MNYPSDIFFYSGAPNQCGKDFNAKKIFQSDSALQKSFSTRIAEIHSEFTEIYSKITCNYPILNKINATPDLLDSINQWRAENLFHRNLFYNRAGQINQWPEQKSMKSSSPEIFFLFRPAESINQFRIISSRQVPACP